MHTSKRFFRSRVPPVFFLAISATIGHWSTLALGADSTKVNVALLGGLSFPSLSSGAFTYGVKGSYRLMPALLVGFYYLRYGIGLETTDSNFSAIANTSVSIYGLEGLFNFSSGFSAGGRLGLIHVAPNVIATDSVNTVQISSTNSSLSFAPTINYDYPLGSFFSVGGEVSYFFALGGSAPSVVTILGQAKISF